ncbi:MAG: hypothetical protein ING59_03300 [Burkholderiales bacterium]|jgi:hypothetical protein|nr:hypothetical protein [Burkholderiales bacterium]
MSAKQGDKKANPLAGMASTMTDGMEMMRKVWGMTGLPQIPTTSGIAQFAQGLPQALPSMITPTLDIGEMDKRITDLRAVEQWLNLNATMLRTTIQTLEVQRNTIATLKTFSGNVLATMNTRGGSGEPKAPVPYAAFADAMAGGDTSWPPHRERTVMPQVPTPEPEPKRARRSATARQGKLAKSAADKAPTLGAMPINAAAWWGALQDQFARVAAAAVPPTSNPAKPATRKAPVNTAKRARRKAASSTD